MTSLALPLESGSADVVAAALAGDEQAFAELADRYRPELLAHAARMLGSPEDAEDAVQETLLRAWRGRTTFRGRSTFRTWLYGIATNTCLTAIERRRRGRRAGVGAEASGRVDPVALLETLPSPGPEPEAQVAAREGIDPAVRAVVRELPAKQRAVLFLGDVLGWSAKDTADLLGTSVASVNSARQRARSTMRARLAEHRREGVASRRWSERAVHGPELRGTTALAPLVR